MIRKRIPVRLKKQYKDATGTKILQSMQRLRDPQCCEDLVTNGIGKDCVFLLKMAKSKLDRVSFFTPPESSKTESDANDVENGTSKASYKKTDYIPSKFANNRFFKFTVIIGSIVTVIVLISIIVGVTCSEYGHEKVPTEAMTLVVAGSYGFGYFNVTNKTLDSRIVPFDLGHGAYEFHGLNSFMWYNRKTSAILQYLASDILANSTSDVINYFFERRVEAQDMAYDSFSENLYVIDKSTGCLIVINHSTRYHDILLTGLIRPFHIELDSQMGILFIMQQSDSILRASMDGTSVKKIIISDYVTAMTVDTRTKRIYFVIQNEGIVSSDYDGQNHKSFSMDASNIQDLAIVNNELFWLMEINFDDSPTHYLLSCDINYGICDDHQVQEIDYLGDFASIKATPTYPKRVLPEENPCSANECQHFCLLSSNGKPSCACELDWQLDLDKKSCKKVEEFMLYTLDNYFRARVLDSTRNNSIDVILPTRYKIEDGKKISFDYSMKNDRVFFSDNKNIYSMKLIVDGFRERIGKQSIILQGNNDTNIKDIAFDWMTDNLYYIESKPNDGYRLVVFNVNLGSQYNKTLIDFDPESTPGNWNDYGMLSHINDKQDRITPNSLAIHPKLGYLTYLLESILSQEEVLHIVTTNGTEVKQISESTYHHVGIKSIAVDYNDESVYLIDKEFAGKIKHVNFDETNVKDMTVEGVSPILGLSVHRKWMYVNSYHDIYRVDKATGRNKIKMVPMGEHRDREVGGVKIFSELIVNSKDFLQHPCNVKPNGGCDQFCFADNTGNNMQAICACRDSEIFGPYGKCIERNSKKSE